MLAYVVQDGTGISAQIPGYQVAGKTGTAKKLDPSGHYVSRYVASFIGFLPASRPRVVVAVIIDEPRTVYGGVAAAPVFQEVARYAIQRLGIEPSAPLPLPPHRSMPRRRPASRAVVPARAGSSSFRRTRSRGRVTCAAYAITGSSRYSASR